MRKFDCRKCFGILIGATMLPVQAKACYYHWLMGMDEPTGIWPAFPSPADTASAVSQLQSQDSLDDAAVSATTALTPALPPAGPVTDPSITSWLINTTGTDGHSTNTVVNSVVSKVLADVQTVAYTDTNVYIKATGVPSHTLGSYSTDPAIPTNVNRTVDIPRFPVVNNGTKTTVGLGNIGVAVNGVAFYNAADAMSYNNAGVWHQNANVFEASTFDGGPGHPSPIMGQTVTTSSGTAPAGNYHYHQAPTALVNEIDPGNTGQHASPVIGYAFDGFPIFGPYGYVNADGTGGIELMTSGYQMKTYAGGLRTNGPTTTADPVGSYLEDYSYVAGSGTLDQYNGRFAVAPGYPNGTYGYYVTETSAGLPTYPYVIGPQYYGVVSTDDIGNGTITVPGNVTFYTPPVPEPTTCVLLIACACPMLVRRRNRQIRRTC